MKRLLILIYMLVLPFGLVNADETVNAECASIIKKVLLNGSYEPCMTFDDIPRLNFYMNVSDNTYGQYAMLARYISDLEALYERCAVLPSESMECKDGGCTEGPLFRMNQNGDLDAMVFTIQCDATNLMKHNKLSFNGLPSQSEYIKHVKKWGIVKEDYLGACAKLINNFIKKERLQWKEEKRERGWE